MKGKLKLEEHNAVESFQLLAREYCRVVASLDERKASELLTEIASILGKLYSVALLLPDIFPSTNRNQLSKRKLAQHTKRYKHLNDLLAAKLATANSYWKVFDPPDKKSLVSTTLSDDLADICLDLEDGLALRRSGVPRNDFLWQWRFDFRAHWGRHAVSALTAIHHVIAWDYERGSD
jgi:DNA-directed RNA polymerase subunit F